MKNRVYRVDLVVTNQNTFEQKFYVKDFDSHQEAYDYKNEILDDMEYDEYCHWKRIITVITCFCGEELECGEFTNTCVCGRDYNFNGELLASRKQWGIETGEHWTECY